MYEKKRKQMQVVVKKIIQLLEVFMMAICAIERK
jgi:hypothetical protein